MSKSVQLQVVTLQQTQFASKCLIAFLEQFLNLSKSTSNSLLCPSLKVFALENRKPITFPLPQIHSFPCLRFHFMLVMESWFIPNIKNMTFTIGMDIIYSNVCFLQPALHVSYDSSCRKIWKQLSLKSNINISFRKLSVNPENHLVLEISSVPDPPLAPTKQQNSIKFEAI